ncbi:MAG: IS30 family transposase [Thiobacillus sp.]|nr:IS30 family transposase [Thiobacillus sp.]
MPQPQKRRRQRRHGTGRGLIPGRISIDERPELVASRQRFGDWEGDTVGGEKGSGLITTHVERKSRYLIAAKLSKKTAAVIAAAVSTTFRRVPKTLRHTLTLDNGKDFAHFKQIETATGLAIYFADPYSAWQRGTNEITNGLLRRYFPKDSDFRNGTEETLHPPSKNSIIDLANASATGRLMKSFKMLGMVRLESESTSRLTLFNRAAPRPAATHAEAQKLRGHG